jgi:dCTP deaminase
MKEPSVGAVLSAAQIEELSDTKRMQVGQMPLVEGLDANNLKGAAYDLRMAEDGMVLAGGPVVRPGDAPYRSAIVLQPGQTIFVSTRERLNVPNDIVGNMSIKGALANQGVLLLTGLIVDPGYHRGDSGDGRLHFRLANLGRRPVLLEPGRTRLASIQFVRLTEPSTVEPGHGFDDVWERVDEFQEGLGFLEDLRTLGHRVSALETELQRQGHAVNLVVVAVLSVVATTLLGVVITGLLTLGDQAGLIAAAKRVTPNDTPGRILGIAALLALAAIVFALVSGFRVSGRRGSPDPVTAEYARREALRDLRMERARALSLGGMAIALLVVGAVALVTELGVPWWLVTLVALTALLVGLSRSWGRVWWSLPRSRVDQRVRKWERDARPDDGKS